MTTTGDVFAAFAVGVRVVATLPVAWPKRETHECHVRITKAPFIELGRVFVQVEGCSSDVSMGNVRLDPAYARVSP